MAYRSDKASRDGSAHPSAPPTYLEIDMESALSPREIQARVRAGDSVEDVARAAGMALEWVEPFAAPVIAEREYIASLARGQQVRRGAETIPHRNLGEVIEDRLTSRRVDLSTLHWDAWRIEGKRWLIRVDYDSGKAHHEARFVYDMSGRFCVADNDDARWLLGIHSASHGPQPGRRRHEDESESTVDLNDDLALIRVIQRRTDDLPPVSGDVAVLNESEGEVDDAYSEAELAEVDGVYDLLPNRQPGMDVLYEMLSGFDEDSVQIYTGLLRDDVPRTAPVAPVTADVEDEPPAPPTARPVAAPEPTAPKKEDPAPPHSEPDPDPEAPASTKSRGRRKRAEVPSWDEIMFGAPKKRT